MLLNLMCHHTTICIAGMATPLLSRDRPGRSGACVVVRLNVQRLLAQHHTPTQRGAEAVSRRLLYAGAVPGHNALFAKIVLIRPQEPENTNWRMQVRVHGHGDLTGYGVCLSCGEDDRITVTDATGQASFDDVPATWIIVDSAPDLLVTIH